MTTVLLQIAVVLACVAAFAAVAIAAQQRRQIHHLQDLLVHNDQSRRALAEQLHGLRTQMEAPPAQAAEHDLEQRRAQLERLLAASAVADGPWHDTQPLA